MARPECWKLVRVGSVVQRNFLKTLLLDLYIVMAGCRLMLRIRTKRIAITTVAFLAFFGTELYAQVPALRMTPARAIPSQSATGDQTTLVPGTLTPAKQIKPTLKDEEVSLLKKDYDQLSPEDREAMVATYKDLGIDLLVALGVSTPSSVNATDKPTATSPTSDLLKAVKKLNFARTADKVLEARAQIGLKALPMPAASAPIDEQTNWIHLNVLAGEWQSLQSFLKERAGGDAAEMYAHVLQSTNQGDPGLLPEEILAISEACPAELTEWQLTLLAQLLKTAASRSSMGPFLERLRQGTSFFGPQDDGRRDRTAKFLSQAMLAVEAYAYLPILEKAREKGDTQALTSHARYHEARALSLGNTPEAQQQRRTAWDLYCEIAMTDRVEFTLRREAMGQAIELLPSIPPGPATEWLQRVFANKSLAPTGLEAVALKAMRIGNEKIGIQDRASAILMMKDSVDALLNDESVELNQLRVPLRLLTMSLVAAAEETITKQGSKAGVAPETTLLLRALPGERWRSLIEPSLAVRAFKAFIGIALSADNADQALELLAKGIERAPGQSMEMADEFLKVWMIRLNPLPDPRRMNSFIIIGGRQQTASAPLTRGRQDRNLERLKKLLDLLDKIGANGRSLERVVTAFASCHGKAETFRRENVVSVLGPIAELAPSVSARLAESMRAGLNGDWKSRDVQRAAGNQKSTSEIEALIEEGYELALEMIESATHQEPTSWRYAMTKATLAYDHMQFRRQRDQDAASYNAARQELFRAFGEAAKQYQAAVVRGELREDPGVYLSWFSISLGSSDLSTLSANDLLTEGSENTEQIQQIRKQMLEMPSEMADSHLGEFARRIIDKLPSLTPEVKPGVVRRASEIVGDHPAGALLRQTLDMYDDLLRNEIHLHLTVDGSDQVGTKEFGAVLTLRSTAAIGRELGGFSQYLQNNVYSYIGGKYQPINFRDRMQKSIEQAFHEDLELVHIGFFDSMNPSQPIQVDGKKGWEEKPLCYLILKAKDPSVDGLPLLQIDINTIDESGVVVLPVHSNSVFIDATSTAGQLKSETPSRPLHGLQVSQTIDTRDLKQGKDKSIKFEVEATGRGVIPDLDQLLLGLDQAVPGYSVNRDKIESESVRVLGVEANSKSMGFATTTPSESDTYFKADADGLFRLPTTRKWIVKFEPSEASTENIIRVPKLDNRFDGTLRSERFIDMDLVGIETETVPLDRVRSNRVPMIAGIAMVGFLLPTLVWFYLRGKTKSLKLEDIGLRLPKEITPFSAVITLQRFSKNYASKMTQDDQGRLQADIADLENRFFAANAKPDPQLAKDALHRWHRILGGSSVG